MKLLSVSQLARRTGVTVRTLHHYEQRGLLRPAMRIDAGYRLYGEAELRRLQHILSLKTLGLALDAIQASLSAGAPTLAEAVLGQLHRLRETIDHQQALLRRLELLAQRLADGTAIDVDTFLSSIEASVQMENYFSEAQRAAIKQRGEALGPEKIREVEQAWPQVIAGMRAAMQLGKDPASDEVRPLATKWRSLLRAFTGGDRGIEQAMGRMYAQEPAAMQQRSGIDPALMDYARRAVAVLPEEPASPTPGPA